MLTVDDFIQKFDKYSDQELYEVYRTIDAYNEEAKKALSFVIEKKGGIERLTESVSASQKVASEIERIQKETHKLKQSGFDEDFILKAISSELLTGDKVHKIIKMQFEQSNIEIMDKAIDADTIKRSIAAGIIAALISGSLLGVLFIFTGAIHILILIGTALLCYAIVNGIVKKTKNNIAVLITILLSTIIAILLGLLIFYIVGPKL